MNDLSPDLVWAVQSASQGRLVQLPLASASPSSTTLVPLYILLGQINSNSNSNSLIYFILIFILPILLILLILILIITVNQKVGAARLAVQGNRQPGATHILSGEELLADILVNIVRY